MTRSRPPIYFYAGAPSPEAWSVVEGEIALAAQVGQHQFIVPVSISWPDAPVSISASQVMDRVLTADPAASMLLEVDLNPPASWLAAHPESAVPSAVEGQQAVSPASPAWRSHVEEALRSLIAEVEDSDAGRRVTGYVLRALDEGRWIRPASFDTTPVNVDGFRAWLEGVYGDAGTLSGAWGTSTSFGSAAIPPAPAVDNPAQVFLSLPQQQPVADFLRYTSESTADVIAGLVNLIRETSGNSPKVLVPYGYSLELTSNAAGHFALGLLINSNVDGFISPISYVDRGLGGSGGFMGPVDSAHFHGKLWHLLDDTRTGVSLDPISGEIGRLKGLRAEDVFNVQRRNFAAATIHQLGLIWADPSGEGWLHDAQQWEVLANLRGIYTGVNPRPMEEGEGAPEGAPATAEIPAPGFYPDLMVVVDEASRFVQQCTAPLNDQLLHVGRDAALRSGVSTQFCLLQDVLEDRSPGAVVYLFLNVFRLTDEQRQRLHERLAAEKACAIWMYAPGYFNATAASLENVAATVKMNVKMFDKPQMGGSQFALDGGWMKSQEGFGLPVEWGTLFYIEDDEADVVATYTAGAKPSAAIRFLPEEQGGWTSIFVAEPTITPGLLRELLLINYVPTNFRSSPRSQLDTIHLNDTLIAIHGKQAGEAFVDLGQTMDVIDLYDPDIGWPGQSSFLLPLQTGETRLLQMASPQ